VLRDPQSSKADRLTAADLSGSLTVMSDEMAEALLAIVRNGSQPDDVRARAAISLGPALESADTEAIADMGWDAPISETEFDRVREELRKAFEDRTAPKEVRRRVLEGSVRAPQDWHTDAVREAYSSGDREWTLTAAFCMRYVPGFNAEIMKLLESKDAEIYYEAISAAGEREVEEAWPHVRALLKPPTKDKHLLLAAIEAAPGVNPEEARMFLADLLGSNDEEIVEAADEAIAMAEGYSDEEDQDDDEEDEDEEEEDL
jgi:hypothetical protein